MIPTPLARDAVNRSGQAKRYLEQGEVNLQDWIAATPMWPTPTATMADRGGRGDLLQAARGNTSPSGRFATPEPKRWPTPCATDYKGPNPLTRQPCDDDLPTRVLRDSFATPTARDWRSGKASPETHAKNSRPLSEQIGGSLNPTWVEALMGFPFGWTDTDLT